VLSAVFATRSLRVDWEALPVSAGRPRSAIRAQLPANGERNTLRLLPQRSSTMAGLAPRAPPSCGPTPAAPRSASGVHAPDRFHLRHFRDMGRACLSCWSWWWFSPEAQRSGAPNGSERRQSRLDRKLARWSSERRSESARPRTSSHEPSANAPPLVGTHSARTRSTQTSNLEARSSCFDEPEAAKLASPQEATTEPGSVGLPLEFVADR
jgi:hypothetical protein